VKKLLYICLVIVLVGCAKPAGPKKIDIDIHNLYDKVYDPPNTIVVANMSLESRWWMVPDNGEAAKPVKQVWWKENPPITQPTSRPVKDIILTPKPVEKKLVERTPVKSKMPKKTDNKLLEHGLEVVTCDDDVKKYGNYSHVTDEEYIKFKKEFE